CANLYMAFTAISKSLDVW
nr:immunoglobulin heavy chain junction region [Macaca mulatta]MOX91632.1 immunoglobulin heavy chain junction region [Macaca mulatta]MOX91671.1 immunoglobulin heavy chain junction region [Macaca mulatta]MOX91682.1 immunoglobulin heavy chain junction region [Macaca mulatta]MOX91759.1 immunoglobulin heavy chain junction region [Macaca mulatta]